MVKLKDVCYHIQQKTLVQETSVCFEANRFHVIMGANGAGKSTLLKLLSGYLPSSQGQVLFQQKNIQQYSKITLAKKRAVLSQQYAIMFPILVKDIVMMGRYPFFKSTPTAIDKRICTEAMQLLQMEDFAERQYHTLSGGEAQKVQMCRILAQIWEANEGDEKTLFLDEPVSGLDVKYQYQLMNIAKDLCQRHITIIAVLHDINLALTFADRILFMKHGSILYDLDHPSAIRPQIIHEVFDINATIETIAHKPVVLF